MTTVVEPVLPGQDQIRITYIGPLSQWVFKAIVVMFVTILLSTMFAAIMWGVVGPAIWKHSPGPPLWWHWAVGLLLLALVIGLVKITSREMRRKIVLTEDHFWIGGFVFGQTYPYERVRLIKLTHPEKTIGKSHQLVIESGPTVRRNTSLWLKPRDAEECFEAMRSLCPQAPAIGLGDEAFRPAEEKFAGAGHAILAQEFRKKSRQMLRASIAMLVFALALGAGLIFGGPGFRQHPKPWIGVVALPVFAAGSFIASRRHKHISRKHLRESQQVDSVAND